MTVTGTHRPPSRWHALARLAATAGVVAVLVSVRVAGDRADRADAPAVRIAVQVLATPTNGPTGKVLLEVPRVLQVGQRFTAFLGAGDEGNLCLVGGHDVAAAVDGFDHRWEVEVAPLAAGTDRIVIDVTWRRIGEPGGARRSQVTLREDEAHVLDFVSTSEASASPCANALVRVTASVSTAAPGPTRLFEYELWLVHDDPGGGQRVDRVAAAARSGELLPYHFKPLHWALLGEGLDQQSRASVQMDIGGSLRGRMREDGTVDVELRTTRAYRWGAVETNGGGTKKFYVRPDETVAVQLPPAGGVGQSGVNAGAPPRVGRGAPGVSVRGEQVRVDFGEFFAGHRSTVYLTVHEVH